MKILYTILLLSASLLVGKSAFSQSIISAAAQTALSQNNTTPALEELGVLLAHNPKNELALIYRANILNRVGQYAKALEDAVAVIGINPKSLNALLVAGLAKTGLWEFKDAVAYFDQALEINPKFIQAIFFRGRANLHANNNQKALEDFNSFLLLEPNNIEARYYRASPLALFKKYDDAINDLQFVVTHAKPDSQIAKAASIGLEKAKAEKAKKQQGEIELKEIGDFFMIYKEVERLQGIAKPYIDAIKLDSKADEFVARANAMEKALPHIKTVVNYMDLKQKIVDAFVTDEGVKARARWANAKNLYQSYENRNSVFDIANYRYSGTIYQNIKNYLPVSSYTMARANNDKAAFEKHQKEDLSRVTENLQLIKEALMELPKLSPEKYVGSKNSYEETQRQTLVMIETIKNAKF